MKKLNKDILRKKANWLLSKGVISRIGKNRWECDPIPGYNVSVYLIDKVHGHYRCTCAGYRMHKYCSHVEAVKILNRKRK